MTRAERLRAGLVNIAETADHTDHRYLICGKCMAARAVVADDAIVTADAAKRKAKASK